MKKVTLFSALLFAAVTAFSQSMRIQMTDQSIIAVNLAELDSITFSGAAAAQVMDLSEWTCVSRSSGLAKSTASAAPLEQTEDGLKLYGNNVMVYQSISSTGALANRKIFLKWTAIGESANMFIDLLKMAGSTTSCQRLRVAGDASILPTAGTWYFTRIAVTGLAADVYTGIGDYDTNGGTTLWRTSVGLPQPACTFAVGSGGTSSTWITLAEARIE